MLYHFVTLIVLPALVSSLVLMVGMPLGRFIRRSIYLLHYRSRLSEEARKFIARNLSLEGVKLLLDYEKARLIPGAEGYARFLLCKVHDELREGDYDSFDTYVTLMMSRGADPRASTDDGRERRRYKIVLGIID